MNIIFLLQQSYGTESFLPSPLCQQTQRNEECVAAFPNLTQFFFSKSKSALPDVYLVSVCICRHIHGNQKDLLAL